MAGIDRFIEVAAKYGADGLVFDSDQRAVIVTGDSRRYVTAQAVSEQQVQELVREILPKDMTRIRSTETGREFDYACPQGAARVSFQRHAGGTRVAIHLVNGAAESPAVADAAPPPNTVAAAEASSATGNATATWTRDEDEPDARELPGAESSSAEAPAEASAAPASEPVATARAATAPTTSAVAASTPPASGASTSAAATSAIAAAAPAPPAPAPRESAPAAAAASRAASGSLLARDGRSRPKIEQLFETMVEQRCSDLHLCVGSPPLFRKDGEITSFGDTPALTADEIHDLLLEITPHHDFAAFDAHNDSDFSYEMNERARFRVNLFQDRRGPGAVFRFIPGKIPTPHELGFPKAVVDLCTFPKGLVLVTGPTGSGKSTTLAALIDHINSTRSAHIITIEDPIEFVYTNRKSLVNQREVGVHTASFKSALRAALREDPDIVLVGEMRDLETVAIALETAETGHLVFGTLHTTTASSAIDRIIDQFATDRQTQVRTMLADTLRGVIAQALVKRRDGGLIAAQEVLIVNSAVSNLIREGKTYQIPSVIQTSRAQGMMTMDEALLGLVRSGLVEADTALSKAPNRAEFTLALERLREHRTNPEPRRVPAVE